MEHTNQEYQEIYHRGFMAGYQAGYHAGLRSKPPEADFSQFDTIPMEALGLSARAYHCMRFAGCSTVADIAKLPEAKIQRIRNLGKKTISEITQALRACGVRGTDWDLFLLE